MPMLRMGAVRSSFERLFKLTTKKPDADILKDMLAFFDKVLACVGCLCAHAGRSSWKVRLEALLCRATSTCAWCRPSSSPRAPVSSMRRACSSSGLLGVMHLWHADRCRWTLKEVKTKVGTLSKVAEDDDVSFDGTLEEQDFEYARVSDSFVFHYVPGAMKKRLLLCPPLARPPCLPHFRHVCLPFHHLQSTLELLGQIHLFPIQGRCSLLQWHVLRNVLGRTGGQDLSVQRRHSGCRQASRPGLLSRLCAALGH